MVRALYIVLCGDSEDHQGNHCVLCLRVVVQTCGVSIGNILSCGTSVILCSLPIHNICGGEMGPSRQAGVVMLVGMHEDHTDIRHNLFYA